MPNTVYVLYLEEHLWGVFSTEKKAKKALKRWSLLFEKASLEAYVVDYRITTMPPVYVSDKVKK